MQQNRLIQESQQLYKTIYQVIQKSKRTFKMNNLKTNKEKKDAVYTKRIGKKPGLCGNEKKRKK